MHKHGKTWTLEVVLITDGESSFDQAEYEEAMETLDNLGVKLTVLGVGFDDPGEPVDKSKSKPKRLSEKFWRVFIRNLEEQIAKSSTEEQFRPQLKVFEPELSQIRMPRPDVVNGTQVGTHLYIGAEPINAEQAICIPLKYTKATAKARPPSLSKAWKTAVDLQQPAGSLPAYSEASQLRNTLQSQSQSQGGPADNVAALVSADVKQHSTYFLKKIEQAKEQGSEDLPTIDEDEGEREYIPKEELVKAWRYGSSWIPVEDDTFEPLQTQKGVEVLGFIPQKNVRTWILDTMLTLDPQIHAHRRGPLPVAGSQVLQSADSVLVLRIRSDYDRHGGHYSLGHEGWLATRDRCVHPSAGVRRRQSSGPHVLDPPSIRRR